MTTSPQTGAAEQTLQAAAQRKPIDVSGTDMAFGRVKDILPPMKEIPEEFGDARNQWVRWQSDWFYSGLKRWPVPRDGIDLKLAMANLKCVQGSFAPKHEHKMAGVAYLASLWFTSPNGEPIKEAA
jgi:hypothetical protein